MSAQRIYLFSLFLSPSLSLPLSFSPLWSSPSFLFLILFSSSSLQSVSISKLCVSDYRFVCVCEYAYVCLCVYEFECLCVFMLYMYMCKSMCMVCGGGYGCVLNFALAIMFTLRTAALIQSFLLKSYILKLTVVNCGSNQDHITEFRTDWPTHKANVSQRPRHHIVASQLIHTNRFEHITHLCLSKG